MEIKQNEARELDTECGKNDIPNKETLRVLFETERKIRNGSIERFSGSTDEFFRCILEDSFNE